MILTDLKCKADEASSTDPWFASVRSLGVEGGPLDQFKETIGYLARKLKPGIGMKRLGKVLVWTLNKNEINNVLSKIERLKTLVSFALQEDHL